jgi:outer membrane protein assembly factor BamB
LVGWVVVTAIAADWPAFRGPNGDGHASGGRLPVQWSETANVQWKRPVPGEGWSSPVVSTGRIYLTAAVPQTSGGGRNYSLRLLAFEELTGNPLFDVEVFQEDGSTSPSIHTKNSHASPSPLVAAGKVFVHFGHEGTACLDLNGKQLWQNRELRYLPRHGAGGTPILVGRALIFSCDGESDPFIAALDAGTGRLLWKTPRQTDAEKKFSFATATAITVDGKQQVITAGSNQVCALDPDTGREIWQVRYDGYSVIPKPIFGHGLVFVCTGYNTPQLLAIRPNGRGDVTDTHVAWIVKRSVPHTSSLVLVGDWLFMVSDNGVASCLAARTGESLWQERLGGAFSASPLHANGLVYFCDEQGTTTVVKASSQFERVAENPVGERTLASFAVSGNSLLLRGDRHLFRISEGK